MAEQQAQPTLSGGACPSTIGARVPVLVREAILGCSRWFAFSVTWLAIALVACHGPRSAPEQEVRALLEVAEAAAEARDLDALSRLISDNYVDANGLDRAALRNMLRLMFLRNRSIHLVTRVGEVAFPNPDQAQVSLLVALASRPIPSDAPLQLSAHIYRFDLLLVDEGNGDWRLNQAAWHPARGGDLILGTESDS